MTLHPKPRRPGQSIEITQPHSDSPAEHWADPTRVAAVTPEGAMPPALNGIPFSLWADAPESTADWVQVAGQAAISEPPFEVPEGMRSAAGVVILETDGRVWLVSPSNRFAGYTNTFPKGTQDEGLPLQATAIKEAFEESGLRAAITGHLLDVTRSASHTRYYLAQRVAGNPAEMGWESQAVHLVPRVRLPEFLTNPNDACLCAAIMALPS